MSQLYPAPKWEVPCLLASIWWGIYYGMGWAYTDYYKFICDFTKSKRVRYLPILFIFSSPFLNLISKYLFCRNVPRSIVISIPLVTVCYVLINISYLAVMTSAEMIESEAVAIVSIPTDSHPENHIFPTAGV
jgi:hypothetical protein